MNYYVERVAQAVITFASGMFLTYALYRLVPGGPLEGIMQQMIQRMQQEDGRVQADVLAQRAERLTGINPDQGIIMGYIDYMLDIVLNGDFGQSIAFTEPVFQVLFRAMPWSIFISVYGLILGFSATILIGALMAWHEGTKVDSGLTMFVLTLNAIPYYVVAIVMLVVLGFDWGLFPTGGRYPSQVEPGFNMEFMVGIVRHAALPILSSFIVGFGGGSLSLRGNAIRIIGSDYLRSAKIRGLSSNRILTRYLTRNAILPIYTGLMIGIAALFSSSVITERIFQYPGVGWYIFEALVVQDYPMIMGAFIFFTGLTVTGIFIADLTYGLIDPRAGSAADREAY